MQDKQNILHPETLLILRRTVKEAVKEALEEFLAPLLPSFTKTEQPINASPTLNDNTSSTKNQPDEPVSLRSEHEPVSEKSLNDEVKTIILLAPSETLREWLECSPLADILPFKTIYELAKNKNALIETLTEFLQLGMEIDELGLEKLRDALRVEELPDMETQPIEWIVAVGHERDTKYDWQGLKPLIEDAYNLLREKCGIKADVLLDILLSLNQNQRTDFVTDLAVLSVSPTPSPDTVKVLKKYGLFPYLKPFLKQNPEIPFSEFVSRVQGQWGKECGLGGDEVEDRIFGYMDDGFKVEFPVDEIGEHGDESDDETIMATMQAIATLRDEDERERVKEELKGRIVEVAEKVLGHGWRDMDERELEQAIREKGLREMLKGMGDIEELAAQLGWAI